MKKRGKVMILCLATATLVLGLTVSVISMLSGDVNGNGQRDSNDLAWIRMFFMKQATPTHEQLEYCDLNGNGRVDSNDYLTMRRYLLGMIGAEDYDLSRAVIVIRPDASETVRAHVSALQEALRNAYGAEVSVVAHSSDRVRRPLEFIVGQQDGIALTDPVGRMTDTLYLISAVKEGDARRLVLGGTTDYATAAALDRYAASLPQGSFTMELESQVCGSSALPEGASGSFLLDADGTFSVIDVTRPQRNELDTTPITSVSTYWNPVLGLNAENAWENYGFGDPFIMRYNGMYYLYVSTRDDSIGVKCWQSRDLVNWSYAGNVTDEPLTKCAYAPEVIYYNGAFYMYTSPGGNGHRILRAESPTGPFTLYNEQNFGMTIDGSPFIDKDGKWYFFNASFDGIYAYRMYAPDGFLNFKIRDELCMDGWTEGPMVVYHDGRYYITYTGNHVLTYCYRINYGSTTEGPDSVYTVPRNNPVLISTSEALHGLGHSSTVKGPDLDGYYMAYHSLVALGWFPCREFHLDRIVFNGAEMRVLGATTVEQQLPAMPDIYHFFGTDTSTDGWTVKGSLKGDGTPTLTAGSAILSDTKLSGNYTAEFVLSRIGENGMAGAVFSYQDAANFGLFLFNPVKQTALISFTVDNTAHVTELPLATSFGEDMRFDCVQSMQVELRDGVYAFYINDRLVTSLDSTLPAGAIGYVALGAEAEFSYIGASCHVGGNGLGDQYKTISDTVGDIPAEAYTNEAFPTVEKDGVFLVTAEQGNILNYRVLVASDGSYDCTVRYAADAGDVTLVWYCDGVRIGEMTLAATEGNLQNVVLRALPLTKGQHILSCKVETGAAAFLKFEFLRNESVTSGALSTDNAAYYDGVWQNDNGALTAENGWGKRLYGSPNWGDYTVETNITLGADGSAGVLARATNPGTYLFINNAPDAATGKSGATSFIGYAALLSSSGVSLCGDSYGETECQRAEHVFEAGKSYRLKVVCRGAEIQVYVDDVLYLDYTDPDARMQGYVGICLRNSSASAISDVTVKPLG